MRIYIPLTVREIVDETCDMSYGYGVTPAFLAECEADEGGRSLSEEEAEEYARDYAADASLYAGLCDGEYDVRRIVASVEYTGRYEEEAPGVVALRQPFSWRDVVSIHMNDDEAVFMWNECRAQLACDVNSEELSAHAFNDWLTSIDYSPDMDWYDISELATVCTICQTSIGHSK